MKIRTFDANQKFRVKRNKKARRRFYERNGRRCWYCGAQLKKKKFRLEHQTPFSKGGSCKLRENIVLSCESCDREKANQTVEQFRIVLQARTGEPVVFYGELRS